MSRDANVNLIANQIVKTISGLDTNRRDLIRSHFERLTLGLTEHERQRVARLVNFRLAAAVL